MLQPDADLLVVPERSELLKVVSTLNNVEPFAGARKPGGAGSILLPRSIDLCATSVAVESSSPDLPMTNLVLGFDSIEPAPITPFSWMLSAESVAGASDENRALRMKSGKLCGI